MFQEGEIVKCITDDFSELKRGNYYTVMFATGDGRYISLLEEKGNPFNQYYYTYFISLLEERKLKIDKIKEKICSKKVKKLYV